MEWVFGDSFVCPNLDISQKVAFHPKIQKRCITLDGDVVDPRGTLSGGSAIRVSRIYIYCHEVLVCNLLTIEILGWLNAFKVGRIKRSRKSNRTYSK